METFLAAFLFFVLAVAGMAVGVMLQGKRLSGSCGGRLPDGTKIGDCHCEKTKQDVCGDRKRLYQIDLKS
ncbi:MAG: hypothetical protein H6829_00265 [Planctomycetes bacterium]|nr:hypothetical protein [Planctomycetota bacterium]MCB9913146.1 hypothetical protein [Planctomycetota bacterium]HPF15641.1 hypothetical protein [Planctomycetota bacterium]HRV80150.1 hypothetical protein [Planctomycetota bacterium]